MFSRVLMTVVLLVLPSSADGAQTDERWVEGTYRNPALGYSIKIPHGLKGKAGGQSGPERGIGILLPSGGTVSVFGEPNSLEWKTPEDGLRDEMSGKGCALGQQEVKRARVGKLSGAKASVVCPDRVLTMFLVFRRKGGSPMYWLRLDTTRAHESEDDAILESIAARFKLIRWE